MKDKFEQFAEENRDGLDVFEPRPELWDAVHEKLHRKKIQRRNLYMVAASILLLLSIGAWRMNSINTNGIVVNPSQNIAANPENKMETYYTGIIETRRNELYAYCNSQPVLCSEFKKDLDTLDIHYNRLKTQYNTSVNKDVILQAMIQNLQLQLQILSQQLNIIQKVQSKKEKILTA
jgi:hypothetical protein